MTVLRSRLLKLKQQEENDKYAKERKDQVELVTEARELEPIISRKAE